MEFEVTGGVPVFESKGNCLECQYLHRPNPEEDSFICLRNLRVITHELDEPVGCEGFDEIRTFWVPHYIDVYGNYT
jgi:hypothetical protein